MCMRIYMICVSVDTVDVRVYACMYVRVYRYVNVYVYMSDS